MTFETGSQTTEKLKKRQILRNILFKQNELYSVILSHSKIVGVQKGITLISNIQMII